MMKHKHKISRKKAFQRALTILLPMALIVGTVSAAVSCRNGQSASSADSSSEEVSSDLFVGEASSAITPSSAEASSAAVSSGEASSAGTPFEETSSEAVSSAAPAPSSQPPVPSSQPPALSSNPPTVSAPPVSSAPPAEETKPNTGIYAAVTWRSPYAETADIFKHGRELMLLNNYYELPQDFQWNLVRWPSGEAVDAMSLNNKNSDKVQAVDAAAYQPLQQMFAAAKAAGVPLQLVSPYRSINLQDRLFGELVTRNLNAGLSRADAIKKANVQRTFTGTSEHNTGLGFDLSFAGNWSVTQSFEQTAQFKWLQQNAAEYGFVLRYAADKVKITGIMYEPWHYRYVGAEHAKEMVAKGMCLEEYIAYLDGKG